MGLLDRREPGATRAEPEEDVFLLGPSAAMRDIEAVIRRVADRTLPVLLTGETGTGKEVCARLLHSASYRSSEPFIAVNCAAIPADLLESEVFGHERGAFSGAHQRHLGFAERARNGVLFLDEISEMPLALQAKILRLLEERSFHRVGGSCPVPLQARLVCATNQQLSQAIRLGRFREDLYYRINTVELELPPLRDRPEDVAWLMGRFFEQASEHAGTGLRGIGQPALDAALRHLFPGNARELRNRVERAVALANGPWLMPLDLFPEQRSTLPPSEATRPAGPVLPLAAVRDAAERRHIELVLKESKGQIGMACSQLRISRTTLWEKMRRYGLLTPPITVSSEAAQEA